MNYNILVSESLEEQNYIESCARIRGMAKTTLMRKVMSVVLRDQLVLAILDDTDYLQVDAKADRVKRQHNDFVKTMGDIQSPNHKHAIAHYR